MQSFLKVKQQQQKPKPCKWWMRRDRCGENCLEAAKESVGIPWWLQGCIHGECGAHSIPRSLKLVKHNEMEIICPLNLPHLKHWKWQIVNVTYDDSNENAFLTMLLFWVSLINIPSPSSFWVGLEHWGNCFHFVGHSSVKRAVSGVDLGTSPLTWLWVLLTDAEEEWIDNCVKIINSPI